MRILVTGSSGLIGQAVVKTLSEKGHEVVIARRAGAWKTEGGGKHEELSWDPRDMEHGLDARALEKVDAAVHLAGASLAGKRWTEGYKEVIRESRVKSTRLIGKKLGEAVRLAETGARRKVLVCASAIGIYGDRGEEVLRETSAPGRGFLAEVTREWEAAAQEAEGGGVRVCCARFGLVIDPSGKEGAMRAMTRVFKLGLGGRLGSGRQWWSWVALRDAARAVEWMVENEGAKGAYNVVSPGAVRNAVFTKALARVMRRPAVLPVPGWAMRMVLGAMAEAAVLSSARVEPRRLKEEGFGFEVEEVEKAISGG